MNTGHNLFSTDTTKKVDSTEELNKLKVKIANLRKECTKDYFTLSLGQLELLNKIEKYLNVNN